MAHGSSPPSRGSRLRPGECRPVQQLQRSTFLLATTLLLLLPQLGSASILTSTAHLDDTQLPHHFFHAPLDRQAQLGSVEAEAVEDDRRGTDSAERATSSTIEDPVFIPFDERQSTDLARAAAFRFVFTHLATGRSRFVLYPRPFTTTGTTNPGVHFDQGALVSTTTDGFDNSFVSLADSGVALSSAKALYDISIAILTIEGQHNGLLRPLTYEAFDYCAPLYNYLSTKYAQCWRSSDYWAYLAANPAHEATSVVYVDAEDVKNGKLLLDDGFPRFGVLIVPDIYAGSDAAIAAMLGTSGTTQLQNYIQQGGLVFSSGKGAVLLQTLGLVDAGTFDTSNTLVPKPGRLSATVKGCGEITGTPDPETEWVQRALCFSPSTNGSSSTASLQSAPLVTNAGDFTVVSQWDGATVRIKNGAGAVSNADPDRTYPHILWKPVGKGQLVVHLGNPVLEENSFGWFFDALFVAMSKPFIIDTEIISGFTAIPAFEQVALGVKVDFKNLFDEPLSNVQLIFWLASGIKIQSPLPTGCTIQNNVGLQAPGAALNSSFYIDCSPATGQMNAFDSLPISLNLFIEDVSITQRGLGIPLVYPQTNYTMSSRDDLPVFVDWGPVTVDAYEAALVLFDPADPSAMSGSGIYVDNVLTAENKANTNAFDVTFINYVPLISPLVDIDNQAAIASLATFDWRYYDQVVNNVANYSYPFALFDPRDYDYLDYALLLQRGDLLAGDWDIPVKNNRSQRNSDVFGALPMGNVSDIGNSGYASSAPSSTQFVTRQDYFADADSFYTLAVPRMLAFMDLANSKAYSAYNVPGSWPTGSPTAAQLNPGGTALRKNVAFARSDVYYYHTREGLPLPDGLTPDSTFSLDQYQASSNECGASTADILVASHFGREMGAFPTAFPRGYRGAEWQNELLLNCDKRAARVDISSLSSTNGPVRKVHYIVPFTDNSIASGDDVMGFIKDTSVTLQTEWYYSPQAAEGVSRFGEYRDVRIVPVWYASFELNPNVTRKGGSFTFTLPASASWQAGDLPIQNGYINYGADQVAIQSSTYDAATRTIKTVFKRGNMPNEAYGKNSQMTVSLERLRLSSSFATFEAGFTLQELIYDLSAPAPHETYHSQSPFSSMVTFTSMMSFSLPALRLEYKLKRGDDNSSFALPYELFEPFSRNGMYFQELRAHQTVWGSAEIHPDHGDPGLVTTNGAFSLLASLGISSIPFREYLTTGSGQLIPLAAETSRVEWSDIWDRPWAQPVRSTFVDAAPLPGPLRNFQMTTTYELLDPSSGQRSLQWQSDQDLVVRAQVKLLNNYEKWFEHTDCYENQLMQLGKSYSPVVYGDTIVNNNVTDFTSRKQWINYGHKAGYGVCLQQGTVVLSGVSLSSAQRNSINDVQICAESKPLNECKNISAGLPTLKARPALVTSPIGPQWNFATQIYNHWPQGYILDDMWDFTHTDYWDSQFGKGYPWHYDNPLPGVDSNNKKPYNLIAFPVFKGLGYDVAYASNLSHPNFPNKRGWWSDQLQNKDDTLVAGQQRSLSVSVGAVDQIPAWIDLDDITNPLGQASQAKSNLYICEFNRKRVEVNPQNTKHAYLTNVFWNNVVPVDPSLSSSDPRLSSYNCEGPGYSPANISQYKNYLPTDTARDWLYFAANLRGGAKENINVLYKIAPIKGARREGITSVVDGGRFTYWNPALGPNAFSDVDNPVSTVMATRTDLEVRNAIYPTSVNTYNATVIQLLDLSDPDEIERTWTSSIYYNSHGFGDSQVSVYVGGYKGSEALVNPGETTYVRVTFYNNAGFDWNLHADAIDFAYEGSKPISANDLLYRLKHAIQAPISFRFMDVSIPPEYRPYISIKPSNHNIDTAPLQFDFQAINVATVRDGFKGDYHYVLSVADNIPENLRGKIITLDVTLNPQYFDKLPGFNDPTGIHQYQLSIPPIKFGVPLSASSQWPDQVFWTSGFAHNLQFTHTINSFFKVQEVLSVNETEVYMLGLAASEQNNRDAALNALWSTLKFVGRQSVPFTTAESGSQTLVSYNLRVFGDKFPFQRSASPDLAQLYLLVRTLAPQLPYGWNPASFGAIASFADDVGKQKQAQATHILYVRAAGPWIDITYSGRIVTPEGIVIYDQQLYQSNSGVAKVDVTATNSGSDTAFNTDIVLLLPSDTYLLKDELDGYEATSTPDSSILAGGTRVVIFTGQTLAPGEFFTVGVNIRFEGTAVPISNKRQGNTNNRTVISNSGADVALSADDDAAKFSQLLYNPYQIGLTSDSAYEAILHGWEENGVAVLNVSYSDVVIPVEYAWYRRNTSDSSAAFVEFVRTNGTVMYNNLEEIYPTEYKVVVIYTGAAIGDLAVTQSNIVQFDESDDRGALFWFLVIGIPLIAACLAISALVLLLLLAAALIRRRHNREQLDVYDTEATRGTGSSESFDAAAVGGSAAAASKPGRRSFFGLGPVITTDEGSSKPTKGRWVVDMDYLFTGARRVVVKDGNPTSNKPPPDWDEPEDGEEMDDLSNGGRAGGSSSTSGGQGANDVKTRVSRFRRIFGCF